MTCCQPTVSPTAGHLAHVSKLMSARKWHLDHTPLNIAPCCVVTQASPQVQATVCTRSAYKQKLCLGLIPSYISRCACSMPAQCLPNAYPCNLKQSLNICSSPNEQHYP